MVLDMYVYFNYVMYLVMKDLYMVYNKSFSIYYWLTNVEVTVDFIIVLDVDMIF